MGKVQDKPILSLTNLKKIYGDYHAVNDVSIDIHGGEFITLLGPSGSGKTTVLNMIAGFEFPSDGHIIFQGQPIDLLLPEKRNIGMVFQNYALFPHMTIFDNIAFPLKMRRVNKAEIIRLVAEVLDLVELGDYADRKPDQLSGGQQQRVALARAIVFDPPLLLLDEPLGALDKKLREQMQIELKKLHTRLKKTMIFVTHDQEEALVLSDRIVVLNHGKIEQIGPPNELYDNPTNEFVAGFIGESNLLKGQVRSSESDLAVLKLDDGSEHKLELPGQVRSGDKVCCCLRPEKIILVDDNHTDFHLTGVLEDTIFVGETKRYTIRIGNKTLLNAREMNIRNKVGPKPGDRVKISWEPESIKLIQSTSI